MPKDTEPLVARALADLAIRHFDELQAAVGLPSPELLAVLRRLLGGISRPGSGT